MIASVIIPTYNGEKKLAATLEALCGQSVKEFETVVVIDGSTDNSLNVIRSFSTKLFSLNVHIQENKGRAGSRNAGVRLAKSELLIFIDDDIAVGMDNIERHINFHNQASGDVLVGKPVLDQQRIKGDQFLQYRSRIEDEWNRKFEPGLNLVSFNSFAFTTQNLSLRKPVFYDAGGFDEQLTDSEDFDLSVRLLMRKRKIFYDTTLLGYHNDFANLDQTIKRQQEYYIAKSKILDLHPEYKTLMPGQFEWSGRTRKDLIKEYAFRNKTIWKKIFNTTAFEMLPTRAKNMLYSTFIYTHTVLPVKRSIICTAH